MTSPGARSGHHGIHWAAKLRYSGNVLTESRNGLVVDVLVVTARRHAAAATSTIAAPPDPAIWSGSAVRKRVEEIFGW